MRFFGFLIVLYLVFANDISAQISFGGFPPSFSNELSEERDVVVLPKVDVDQLKQEDKLREEAGKFYRYGVAIPANLSLSNAGMWDELPDGSMVWRLTIKSEDALALGVTYNNFYIPEGGELFLYDKTKDQLLGAYTYQSNPPSGLFANELVMGDELTLEYYEPATVYEDAIIEISEIVYAYRGVNGLFASYNKGYNDAASCHIDANCPEGDNWRNQQKGVARISVNAAGQYGWCSGSLINNTLNDCQPLFLTADHCDDDATFEERLTWVFYFNYERSGCNNINESEPTPLTMTGAVLKGEGKSAAAGGSDFFLAVLSNYVPQSFDAYFNGWRRTNIGSSDGVGIHHPAGDVKKISTYTVNLQTEYTNFWKVYWAGTTTGKGVTEGGSSGSPLFNSDKEIVGMLSFGLSACVNGGEGNGTGPSMPDYYGKMSSAWEGDGPDPEDHLKEWLSPDGSDPYNIAGMANNCASYPLLANFRVLDQSVDVGTKVRFYNLTMRDPEYNVYYQWTFEGVAETSVTPISNPQRTFNTEGVFPVTLRAACNGDTAYLTKYMYVGNVGIDKISGEDLLLYPNPVNDYLNIHGIDWQGQDVHITLYDMFGKKVKHVDFSDSFDKTLKMKTSDLQTGMYTMRLSTSRKNYARKFAVVH